MRGRPILILGLAMAFGTVEAEEEPQGDSFAVTNDRRAGYDWWSLQAVKAPAVPAVKSVGSARNEIDRFVLSRLEAAGLQINPPADRATYIRRLSYDLTGLLPTPEEVQTFVEDRSPDAYETLVDRLLESPHYGERWGRHWLDVVRFAESNGFERDGIRRNFWPYRDYVICCPIQHLRLALCVWPDFKAVLTQGLVRGSNRLTIDGFVRGSPGPSWPVRCQGSSGDLCL